MSMPRFTLLTVLLLGCASTPSRATDNTTAATRPENPGGEHGHHEGHGHNHHENLPAQVTAYHDVLAPIWHSDAGAARDARTCEQAAVLRERAGAVQSMAVPAAAQPREAAWRAAATQLDGASAALVTACGATPRGNVAGALEAAHTAFHALLEALGQEHH